MIVLPPRPDLMPNKLSKKEYFLSPVLVSLNGPQHQSQNDDQTNEDNDSDFNEVLLTEQEAHQFIWSATTKWIDLQIDVLQENRNKDLKKLIKGMGGNKTDKSIDWASRAVGGIQQSVENLNAETIKQAVSGTHSHQPSVSDELEIMKDLRKLRTFSTEPGRAHSSFPSISADPLATLINEEFEYWLKRHKQF
ncbi:Hypothetical predicted protein [Paramuricea clavata]|uniref:Uncharacterized protein n=1 Tax=Paramuricea clavata TaxID=317549 RepID=A0A6S7I0S4_PARCT|nr:Hypothetical predicted protein [Paramuricea clavata]